VRIYGVAQDFWDFAEVNDELVAVTETGTGHDGCPYTGT
jgi:hypothetical protein